MVLKLRKVWRCPSLWLGALGRPRPGYTAAFLAAATAAILTLAGPLASFEQRLSDAWFGIGNVPPTGRTVLVYVDKAAQLRGGGVRIARRDLRELLVRLEAAGPQRILIELGLADEGIESDDDLLAQTLSRLGSKVAISTSAVLARNDEEVRWRRTPVAERFARNAVLTASDLALDHDAQVRRMGVENTGLLPLRLAPVWLTGTQHDDRPFRIDFGIDLNRIRAVDAESILQGQAQSSEFRGSFIIIGNYSSATGYGIAAPRYVELRRPQIMALAAETLLLGRELRTIPAVAGHFAVVFLAAMTALWCARLNVLAATGALVALSLCTLAAGAKLQVSAGLIVPTASGVVACVSGFAAAQIMVHPLFERVRQAAIAVLMGTDFRLAWAVDSASDGLVTFDSEGRVLSANSAARQLLGLRGAKESLCTSLGPQATRLLAAVRERQPCRYQASVEHSTRWVELAVNAVLLGGRWIGIATVRDVTDQHARMESLRHLAMEDALTGALNRRALETMLGEYVERKEAFALLVCDLDGFKQINDTLGHQAGDSVLTEIASRMRHCAQPNGIVGRLGGDEFAVILPHASSRDAAEAASALIEIVARPILVGSQRVTVGISIGVALSSTSVTAAGLMASADTAMYRAKAARSGYDFARSQLAA